MKFNSCVPAHTFLEGSMAWNTK